MTHGGERLSVSDRYLADLGCSFSCHLETYISKHADLSHGICPECVAKLYPDFRPEE